MGIFLLFLTLILNSFTSSQDLILNQTGNLSVINQNNVSENIFNQTNVIANTSVDEKLTNDDGQVFFNIIISILLVCVFAYLIIYLYKKYKISKTRLDYELEFLKENPRNKVGFVALAEDVEVGN